MNQILITQSKENDNSNNNNNNYNNNNKKKKNNDKAPIGSVIKVFAISLLLVGIFIVGFAGYNMYTEKQEEILNPTKPVIVQEQDDKTLLITIVHDKELSKIEYNWNEDSKQTIDCSGQTTVEQEITIPGGSNTLYLSVTDINGETAYLEQLFNVDEDIVLEIVDNELIVTAELETEISYMTYRWNTAEETRIEINDTSLEEAVQIPSGLNEITIVLVDVNNETIQKTQTVNGIIKPTLNVSVDENMENIIITMTDEVALRKLEVTVNDTTYTGETTEKELVYNFPVSYLEEGQNEIKVVVYNSQDVTNELTINCEIIK